MDKTDFDKNTQVMENILLSLGFKKYKKKRSCFQNNILDSMETIYGAFHDEDVLRMSIPSDKGSIYLLSEKIYAKLPSLMEASMTHVRLKLASKAYFLIAIGVLERIPFDEIGDVRKNVVYVRPVNLDDDGVRERAAASIRITRENGITPYFMSFSRLCKIDVRWAESVYGKSLDKRNERRFLTDFVAAFQKLGKGEQEAIVSAHFPALLEEWKSLT